MATIEELEERIERLEGIVYNEIEYPKIQQNRSGEYIHRRYKESGLKVLKAPPTAPVVMFGSDSRFWGEMRNGRCVTAFTTQNIGKQGAIFYVRDDIGRMTFEIQSVEKRRLKTYIAMCWGMAGFTSIDDACEYFSRLYFEEEMMKNRAFVPNFDDIDGYVIKFIRRLDDE